MRHAMRQCSLASGAVFKTSNFESSIYTVFYMLALKIVFYILRIAVYHISVFYFFCIL